MILLQGAGPGGLGLPGGLLERLAFQDEGGQLDRAVGWGREAALCGGEKPGGSVQADDVTQEVRYPLAFLGRYVELSAAVFCFLLCH